MRKCTKPIKSLEVPIQTSLSNHLNSCCFCACSQMNMTLMTTTTLVDRYMESKTCQFTCRNLDRQMIHIPSCIYALEEFFLGIFLLPLQTWKWHWVCWCKKAKSMGLFLYFDETQNVIYSRLLANVIGIFLEHHISQNSCYRRP